MGKQTLQNFSGNSIEIPDRAIIVGCHCDTDEKMLMTENFLSKVRERFNNYDVFLIVASHLSVSEKIQDVADLFILNKNNPIINLDLISDRSKTSQMMNELWRANGVMERVSCLRKNHSYAHHLLIRDAFNFCIMNDINHVHFMNYDSPIKCLSEIEWHVEKLMKYDGVFYQYHHQQYYSTEFFSMNSKSFDKFLSHITTYEQWESFDHIDTEVNYKEFLKTAKIYCDDIFDPDVSDVIGSVSFQSEVNRKGEVDVLKNIVSNFTIIPYERDGRIVINNSYTGFDDPKNEKHVLWESYDENMEQINHLDAIVQKNNWCDYICPEKCKYIKIYIDTELKSFFDITDKRNIGKIE